MEVWGHRAEPAGIGVFVSGAKHVAPTPVGRGPAAMYSLSWDVTLKLAAVSLSVWNTTVPSPGWRGSPPRWGLPPLGSGGNGASGSSLLLPPSVLASMPEVAQPSR